MISQQPPRCSWIFEPTYYASPNLQDHRAMQNAPHIGAGAGALGGAGLGALFATLSGAPAPIGAPLGALTGINLGVGSRRRNAVAERSAAFAELSPVEQQAVIEAFANDMNASVEGVGADPGFETWLARDPQGFQQFMLKNM